MRVKQETLNLICTTIIKGSVYDARDLFHKSCNSLLNILSIGLQKSTI